MIKTFSSKDTERLWETGHSRRFRNIEHIALRKLDMLNAAVTLDALKVPPGNHLEVLKGNRAGLHSIRVNNQWRVCFSWLDGNAYDVEICDYH